MEPHADDDSDDADDDSDESSSVEYSNHVLVNLRDGMVHSGEIMRDWTVDTGEHVGHQVIHHTTSARENDDEDASYTCSWQYRAFMSVVLVIMVSWIYSSVTEQIQHPAEQHETIFNFRLCRIVFFVCCASGALLVASVAAASAAQDEDSAKFKRILGSRPVVGWSAIIFGTIVLLQFELYMMLIFQDYPFACEVYAVAEGVAVKHSGVKTGYHFIGYSGYLEETGNTTIGSKSSGDFDWDVECKDTVSVFGSRGGREVVCLLSHCVPFLILLVYANGLGRHLNAKFAGIFLDFIDLQDFGLLLLDDQMLLAYWDHADMYTSQGGVRFWWAIMIAFMTAGLYISLAPLLKVLAMPRGNESGRCCGLQVSPKRLFMLEAWASLLLIEIPFGTMRLQVSNHMHIFASSLLLKNILSGIYDVLKIASCADPRGFITRYPLLKPFFELSAFYTSEGLEEFTKSNE